MSVNPKLWKKYYGPLYICWNMWLLILLRFGDETLTRFGSQWEMSSAEVLFIQSHGDPPQTLPLCLADQTSPGAGLGGLPVGSWIGLLFCRVPSGVSHMLYVWSCAAGRKVRMYLTSPWGTEGRGVSRPSNASRLIQACLEAKLCWFKRFIQILQKIVHASK